MVKYGLHRDRGLQGNLGSHFFSEAMGWEF